MTALRFAMGCRRANALGSKSAAWESGSVNQLKPVTLELKSNHLIFRRIGAG
jgi:hypothetical protein